MILPDARIWVISIVIGLILLGVAATVNQTMGFAPVLLLFLGVALPTLVLDYRSRLGLRPLTREGLGKKNFTSANFKI
jgi:sulfite exporter TauE/SafE